MSLVYDIHEYTINKYIDNYANFMKYLILVRNSDIRKILKNKYIPIFAAEKHLYARGEVLFIFGAIDTKINDNVIKVTINNVDFFKNNDNVYPNVKKLTIDVAEDYDIRIVTRIFPNLIKFTTKNLLHFIFMATYRTSIKTIKLNAINIAAIPKLRSRSQLDVKLTNLDMLSKMQNYNVHLCVRNLADISKIPTDIKITNVTLILQICEDIEINIPNKSVKKLSMVLIGSSPKETYITISDLPNLERLNMKIFASSDHSTINAHLIDLPYIVDFNVIVPNPESFNIIKKRTQIIRTHIN